MYLHVLLRAYVNQNFYWPKAFDSGNFTLTLNNEKRDNARHITFLNEEKAINVARYNLQNCLHALPMGPSFFNNAALLLRLKTSLPINYLTDAQPVDVIGPIPLENVDIYLNSTWQSARQPEFLTLLNELNTLRATEHR